MHYYVSSCYACSLTALDNVVNGPIAIASSVSDHSKLASNGFEAGDKPNTSCNMQPGFQYLIRKHVIVVGSSLARAKYSMNVLSTGQTLNLLYKLPLCQVPLQWARQKATCRKGAAVMASELVCLQLSWASQC